MSNATITYNAKRKLQAGVNVDDVVVINVTLTAFNQSPDIKKTDSVSMSGIQQSSLLYINETYQCTVVDDGSVATADMEQFLHSVAASESFAMTSIDDNDNQLTCKLSGSWSRTRRSSAYINSFEYSFSVRVES